MRTWEEIKREYTQMMQECLGQHKAVLRVIQIGTFRRRDPKDMYEFAIEDSFRQMFSALGSVIETCRPIRMPVTNRMSGMGSFERGLYLDYLVAAFDLAVRMDQKFEIKEISDGEPLYAKMKEAAESQLTLCDRIKFCDYKISKHGTRRTAKVYKADIPYMEFFYGEDRKFPWQRQARVKDRDRFYFPHMAQTMPSEIKNECANEDHVEVLAWYLREKYWGINLAVEMSGYSPELSRNGENYAKRGYIWNAVSVEPAKALELLMSIPYPAYRMSFARSMLQWYFVEEFSDILKEIRELPAEELMTTVCRLIPKEPKEADDRLKDLTLSSVNRLMEKSILLSILSCAHVYLKTEVLSTDKVIGLPENGGFWDAYKAVLYRMICSEIATFYLDETEKEASLSIEELPLALVSQRNEHAKKLMRLRCADRRNDANTRAYSTVQKLCYDYGLRKE